MLPTLRALPEVVAAVKGKVEVLMDGGIRRGSDIVKAVCLGARAVLVGRAYAYGFAAGGPVGVERALEFCGLILNARFDCWAVLRSQPSIGLTSTCLTRGQVSELAKRLSRETIGFANIQ